MPTTINAMGQAGARAPTAEVGQLTRVTAAAALTGAAVVHATVVGEHLEQWAPAGLFFLILTMVEGGLGALVLLAWTRAVGWSVVVSGIGTVAVWTVSRTVGMPIGPADFRVPEAVGRPDIVCCILELVAAGACAMALARPGQARSAQGRAGSASFVLLGGAVAAVALATALGVMPALSGGGHGHTHADGGRTLLSQVAKPGHVG